MVDDRASFYRYGPGPPLSEFVDFLWIFEGFAAPHARERLLPTGTMELVFRLGVDGRLASGVAGARSEFAVLDTSRPFSVIAVHFKPGGGFPFFGVPSGELHNGSLTLDTVWGADAAIVEDQLWEAKTPERRFGVLETALLKSAHGQWHRHPAVEYALTVFERSDGMRPVSDVLERIGISPRRFGDVFRSEVGLSPKVFCRIRRFNAALRQIEHAADIDWVDIALSCGYFDQAHFYHDFHAFSGINPSTYLQHRTARMHVAIRE